MPLEERRRDLDPVGDLPKGSHDIAELAVDRRHQRVVVAHLLPAVGDLTRPRAVRILGIGEPPLTLKAGDVVRHRIEDHLAQHHLQVAAFEVAQLRLVLDHDLGTGLLVGRGEHDILPLHVLVRDDEVVALLAAGDAETLAGRLKPHLGTVSHPVTFSSKPI